ncbi:MAG: aminotransferase class I/II-fold pyridoxal phosphate-dependent enzyme [Phycisphaerales bacterium JB063]
MTLDPPLQRELDALEQRSLRRSLRALPTTGKRVEIDGRRLLNLAGNDYLALGQHPRLIDAAQRAIKTYGVGSGASRLVTGSLTVHAQAERDVASLKHADAGLLLPTGYMANVAVLGALAGPGDLVCQDKLNHASLIDSAAQCGAAVRTYPHLQTTKLERLLSHHAKASPQHRRFIVTDSVFSMDGDAAELPALCDLADRYDAVLVVDEAHGTGILGETGAGLAELQGVARRVYQCGAGGVVVSTASKALGGMGGIITGSQAVIDTMVNRARPLLYSTAIAPAQAAALSAAVALVRDEPGRRGHLTVLCRLARRRLIGMGWPGLDSAVATPILPLIVGHADRALALSRRLEDAGVLGVAIRPPTVAPGSSRVRLTLRADLEEQELIDALDTIGPPR